MIRNEELKQSYKCGVCGTSHTTALERNKCEYACLKKADEKAKVLRNAEKEKKRRLIENDISRIQTAVASFNKEFDEKLSVEINLKESKTDETKCSNYYETHIGENLSDKELDNEVRDTLENILRIFNPNAKAGQVFII